MEAWRPVVGWEGLYEVSDMGRVRSLPRVVRSRGGTRTIPGRVRKLSIPSNGYAMVNLERLDRTFNALAHRLVLEAFVGPCPPGMEACHGKAGKGDNTLANLSWGTKLDNEADKLRDGTRVHGETCGQSKLKRWQVASIRAAYAEGGVTLRELARTHRVTTMTVQRVVTRQTWRY